MEGSTKGNVVDAPSLVLVPTSHNDAGLELVLVEVAEVLEQDSSRINSGSFSPLNPKNT